MCFCMCSVLSYRWQCMNRLQTCGESEGVVRELRGGGGVSKARIISKVNRMPWHCLAGWGARLLSRALFLPEQIPQHVRKLLCTYILFMTQLVYCALVCQWNILMWSSSRRKCSVCNWRNLTQLWQWLNQYTWIRLLSESMSRNSGV